MGNNLYYYVAESIYISKLRYGAQLLGKVCWNNDDVKTGDLNALQVTYYKLARLINNTRISDKIESKVIFGKLGWLSFNQMNAQIKLLEAWKMVNVVDYPIKFEQKSAELNGRLTRAASNGEVHKPGSSKI